MATTNQPATTVNRGAVIGYGVFCYLAFLMSFGYAVLFVAGIGVPRTVDRGIVAPPALAIAIDSVLLGVFAVQHSVMARPAFKRRWTAVVPPAAERSTFVLAASLVLGLLCWQWRTFDATVWHIDPPVARAAVWTVAVVGWLTVLATTFMTGHAELFGLRQTYAAGRCRRFAPTGFRAPLLYRVVRHPMMLGFLLAFWAAPTMTAPHLLFAAATTLYILIAIQLEEHDLTASLGERYRRYRRQVPMLFPMRGRALRRSGGSRA